jgi:hypothetical protein
MGCRLRQPPIELSANNFDLTPLVGQWSGFYSSPETGRSGTIAFTLRAGESNAFGRVQMVPRGVDPNAANASSQTLQIHFVRKEGRSVVGTLDPYTDPDCGCRVSTTFVGAFTDSRTIEGTYATSADKNQRAPTGGNWKVTLVRRL